MNNISRSFIDKPGVAETTRESGDLGFLYTPAGLPGTSALPAYAVPGTQATDLEGANGRNGSARLAVESSELNALLSSFLTARTPSANPAPSPDVPAETGFDSRFMEA